MKLQFTAGIFPFIILLMLGCSRVASDRTNKEASVSSISQLPENPLEMIPIAVSLQPKAKTMAVLYGNGIAAKRLMDGLDYARGSVLYLVSWKGEADPDWFGACIPGRVTAIERVLFDQNGGKSYVFFKGPGWYGGMEMKKDDRQSIILSIPMATSP